MIKIIRIIGITLMISALIPLIPGVLFYAKTKSFLKTASNAKAIVIEMVQRNSSSRSTGRSIGYAPVYKFTAKDGIEYLVHSSTSSYPPAFKVGQEIPILYDSSNPKKAEIDTFFDIWLVPFVFTMLTIFMLFMGALFTFLGPIIIRFIVNAVVSDVSNIKKGRDI